MKHYLQVIYKLLGAKIPLKLMHKSSERIIMRINLTFILVIFFQVSMAAFGQKLTIAENNITIENFFDIIHKQTGYNVLYTDNLLKKAKRISIQVNQASLIDVLNACFKNQELTYTIEDKTIIIQPKLLEVQKIVFLAIKGRVTDEKGLPLPGATVQVKGEKKAVITDGNGNYSIEANVGSTLIFTYTGYKPEEVSISNQTSINMVLREIQKDLGEFVIVGYGTQKKANLTGAVSSVNMSEVLKDRPVNGTAAALRGAIPSLQITTPSGRPGEASSLQVRGFQSINGGAPLVLVDNIPMSIDDINPADIDNVTVLKDAAASSIYGGRAAFGVILITTKKGLRNQPIKFNFSNNLALTQATNLPEKVSIAQYVQSLKDFGQSTSWTGQNLDTWQNLLNTYQADPSAYPNGDTYVNGVRYGLAEHNGYKDFMKNGLEQIYNLAFSGGSEKSSYRVSLGYADADGIMITNKDSYKRYNVNALLTTELVRNLNATVNVLYKNDNRLNPSNYGVLFTNAIGFGLHTPFGYGITSDGTSLPYYTAENILKTEPASNVFGNDLRLYGKMEYRPLNDLKITGEYTFDNTGGNTRTYLAKNEYIDSQTLGRGRYANNNTRYTRSNSINNYNALNIYANYNKKLGDHNLGIILGTNQEKSKFESFSASRLDVLSDQVPSISTSTGVQSNADVFSEYAISGYFARINYNFKDRYLLEGNARYDGSSRFPSGHRFGFFKSFSAGWLISEEAFMKSIKNTVSILKLRLSYGEIGNQVVGNDYPYIPGMSPFNASWINSDTKIKYLSLAAPSLVSSDFSWETVRSKNIGLDVALVKGKLTGSFDVFQRQTLDMLAPGSELPAVLGAAAPLQNVADLKTNGWELELNWKDKINDFNYFFGIRLSDSRSYITRYKNDAGLLTFNTAGGINNYYVGQRIGDIWGFQTDGFYTVDDFVPGTLNANLQGGTLKAGIPAYRGINQNPGDVRYADLNGDGVIFTGANTLSDSGDRKIIGNNNRRYQFSFLGGSSYKNFDFSFALQGVGKRDLVVDNQLYFPYQTNFESIYTNQLNYWTPTRTDSFFGRIYADAGTNTGANQRIQTRYLVNGAFLRIQNIQLGYTLPANLMKKIAIKSLRVFFSGEDLYTFDHLPKGLDPEIRNENRGGGYPVLKKYSFGLNATL